VTERPSDNGVPLRAVVALALVASLLARGLAPALPGVTVGLESAIVWTARVASLLTLLAATGLVAGIARLASVIASAPGAPLVARLVAVPSVALGCMLLLFASFRPLEPMLALMLGVSAALVGALSARHTLADRQKRAGALVLGLTAIAGLIHVIARKLALDASDAASIAAFHAAQLSETLAALLDIAALALALLWLHRRSARGRALVPLLLALSAICGVLALRGSTPAAGTFTVLLTRVLDPFSRGPSPLLPTALSTALDAGALLTAGGALLARGGDIGIVLAACLLARGALDIPIPALLLELGALYLPFARSAGPSQPPSGAPGSPPQVPLPDTSPP
jgi:hypothetical protein